MTDKDEVSSVSTSTGIRDQQVKLTGSWLKQIKGCGSLPNMQLSCGTRCCRMLWVLAMHRVCKGIRQVPPKKSIRVC